MLLLMRQCFPSPPPPGALGKGVCARVGCWWQQRATNKEHELTAGFCSSRAQQAVAGCCLDLAERGCSWFVTVQVLLASSILNSKRNTSFVSTKVTYCDYQ